MIRELLEPTLQSSCYKRGGHNCTYTQYECTSERVGITRFLMPDVCAYCHERKFVLQDFNRVLCFCTIIGCLFGFITTTLEAISSRHGMLCRDMGAIKKRVCPRAAAAQASTLNSPALHLCVGFHCNNIFHESFVRDCESPDHR